MGPTYGSPDIFGFSKYSDVLEYISIYGWAFNLLATRSDIVNRPVMFTSTDNACLKPSFGPIKKTV